MTTLDEFESMLRINKHQLDAELEVQSETQAHIAREVASKGRRVSVLKDNMESVEFKLVRQSHDLHDKLTVDQRKGMARENSQWLRARGDYQDAVRDLEDWQGLLNAWTSRGFQLKTLADLFVAEYFTRSDSVVHAGQDPRSARAALRQAVARAEEPTLKRRS